MTLAGDAWREFRFCECGNPEDVLELLRRALRGMVNRRDMETHGKSYWTERNEMAVRQERKGLPDDEACALLMRYLMASINLTEHGGAVYGSWLTPKGEALLAFLDAKPAEEWMESEK